MTSFDAAFDDLFGACQRSAVHLEMRDSYDQQDPAYVDWQAGRPFDPADRWRPWFELVRATVARGIEIRRARIVSEPVTDYIRFEYEITQGLNVAAGEQVRWLPRRRASHIALPGNDFWLFDDRLVQFSHFSGGGEWIGVEQTSDPSAIELCASAFEEVWKRAIAHNEFRPGRP